MAKEQRWIIVRVREDKTEYLRHESHLHLWTSDRTLAMEYTKKDVADALARQNIGVTREI